LEIIAADDASARILERIASERRGGIPAGAAPGKAAEPAGRLTVSFQINSGNYICLA